MAFRLKFHDWHDILRVDYTITPQMMEKRQKEKSVWEEIHFCAMILEIYSVHDCTVHVTCMFSFYMYCVCSMYIYIQLYTYIQYKYLVLYILFLSCTTLVYAVSHLHTIVQLIQLYTYIQYKCLGIKLHVL